jgi:hypothetical protein
LNLGKVVITNQTKNPEALDYELTNESHFGTLKQIQLDAHVHREHRRAKMSLLRQYLLETKSENLTTQERIMRRIVGPDFAASKDSQRIRSSL